MSEPTEARAPRIWSDTLFDLGQGILPPEPTSDRVVSARTLRDRALARKRLLFMLQKHGQAPAGTRCGTCAHFRVFRYNNTFFKCAAYGITNSNASDWRARWPACGLHKPAPSRSEPA